MRRSALAKGCAVNIILTRQEGSQRLHLRLAQAGQFADLHDPKSLQLFRRRLISGIVQRKTVVEPFATQLRDKRGFAHTLRAIQNQHGIELASPCAT